jgi:hypothetical protein
MFCLYVITFERMLQGVPHAKPAFGSGSGLAVWQTFVCHKPTKSTNLERLEDCASIRHDPTKMLEPPLSTCRPHDTDKALGEQAERTT